MVNDSAVVVFDDERAVANAGVMLPAALATRLGIEQLVDQTVDLGDRPGAAHPGRKVMTLISAMALGADCIDDCDVLRAGRTADVLGHQVSAPWPSLGLGWAARLQVATTWEGVGAGHHVSYVDFA
jgi:hypothetical protein